MIYFDNAATSGFKPNSVLSIVENTVKYLSCNPGRSAHRLSTTGAKIVEDARSNLASLFNAQSNRVIFTKNCTEALNYAIQGSLKKGGKVITTCFEHNSVLRPLTKLSNDKLIKLETVYPKTSSNEDIVSAIKNAITPDTYLIVMTLCSNVTGKVMPFNEVGKLALDNGLLFIADGAQAGGHINVDIKKNNISMLALAGHKGLCGIMGSGVLILNDDVEVEPTLFGGTGTESYNLSQPSCYPERLESGTLNLPAIASMLEGASYVKTNLNRISKILLSYTEKLIDNLSKINKVKIYSKPNEAGIVAFNIEGIDSVDVADVLNYEYDIAVRSGLHCSPLIHKYLNTFETGLVRASLSVFNTLREIDVFVSAIKNIAN